MKFARAAAAAAAADEIVACGPFVRHATGTPCLGLADDSNGDAPATALTSGVSECRGGVAVCDLMTTGLAAGEVTFGSLFTTPAATCCRPAGEFIAVDPAPALVVDGDLTAAAGLVLTPDTGMPLGASARSCGMGRL